MVKNYLKVMGVVILAVILIYIGRVTAGVTSFGGSSTSFPNGVDVGGGAYASNPVFTVTGTSTISGGLTIGTSGMPMNNFGYASTSGCVLGTKGPGNINSSQAATTTVVYDCPVNGIQSGDTVIGSISTSTVMGMAGWSVVSAKASTTPGYAELGIYNGTGAAAVPSASSVGSSTNVVFIR